MSGEQLHQGSVVDLSWIIHADEEIAAARSTGPLHGIAVTVNGALAVEGMRSTGVPHTSGVA
jgi:hypothetical protein